MSSPATMISISELNTNTIYQPPQEWLDDIEKEEQEIKNSFFSNKFDVWEIIRNSAKAIEQKEKEEEQNALDEWSDTLFYRANTDDYNCYNKTNREMGVILKVFNVENYVKIKDRTERIFLFKCIRYYQALEKFPFRDVEKNHDDAFGFVNIDSRYTKYICGDNNPEEYYCKKLEEIGFFTKHKIIGFDTERNPSLHNKYVVTPEVLKILKNLHSHEMHDVIRIKWK